MQGFLLEAEYFLSQEFTLARSLPTAECRNLKTSTQEWVRYTSGKYETIQRQVKLKTCENAKATIYRFRVLLSNDTYADITISKYYACICNSSYHYQLGHLTDACPKACNSVSLLAFIYYFITPTDSRPCVGQLTSSSQVITGTRYSPGLYIAFS